MQGARKAASEVYLEVLRSELPTSNAADAPPMESGLVAAAAAAAPATPSTTIVIVAVVMLCVLFDFLADLVHVQLLDLLQQFGQTLGWHQTGLQVEEDLLAEDAQGGDALDAELAGQGLLFVHVDLHALHRGVVRGELVEDGSKGLAGPAPGGPEVDEHGVVVGEGLFKILDGKFLGGHGVAPFWKL
jgi:hypothetical protein